jgi:two-component system, OmpR family, alkaline phosphatase synthesis response regulator PhoP
MTLILVVDDEVAIVELLSMFLEGVGYQVMQAYNGQEALDCLASARPDVVISDVMMPVLDGRELCRRMQADPRYRSIPFVLMSAIHTVPSLTGCNCAALLKKPFKFNEVLQIIAHLVKPAGDISRITEE